MIFILISMAILSKYDKEGEEAGYGKEILRAFLCRADTHIPVRTDCHIDYPFV